MDICHHIIKESEVVGIGPLMLKLHPDQVQRELYGSRKLYFFLHLKNQSVKIESDYLDSLDPKNAGAHVLKKFQEDYEKAKTAVHDIVERDGPLAKSITSKP